MRTRVGVAVLALCACSTDVSTDAPPVPAAPLPAELDHVLRDHERAYARRDASAPAAPFAEDGSLLQYRP